MTSASSKATAGRTPLDDLAVIGDPRQIERLCRSRELAPLGDVERPRPAQIEIEAVSVAVADVERFGETAQFAGERMRRLDRARHRGSEQRTGVDVDDFVRARRMKPTSSGRAMRKAGVKRRAPPSGAVRIDQRADFGLDCRPASSAVTRLALPARIEASDMCCAAQPPQRPNHGQNGVARSGLGVKTSTSSSRRP